LSIKHTSELGCGPENRKDSCNLYLVPFPCTPDGLPLQASLEHNKNIFILHMNCERSKISGSHEREYEDDCLQDVVLCSLIERDQHFRSVYHFHHQVDETLP
jgi:hypothetical protein